MLKQDVINYFGTLEKVAKALEISVSAVSQWGDVIPEKNAYRLQELTEKALIIDRNLYKKSKQQK